eukprot:m.469430 g.469430  ORF g.469430 m.469430 type:complete len:494 (+) comp28558_c0_seq1:69-1550(+)
MFGLVLVAAAVQSAGIVVADNCTTRLDSWCNSPLAKCDIPCAHDQKLYALYDIGSKPGQDQRQWRCYAANNTVDGHTKFIGRGDCYCTRDQELAAELCLCNRSTCRHPPPSPPPPLPFDNSTYVVFNSSISPPEARAPVACYRVVTIVQTQRALVAFAEARLGHRVANTSRIESSCADCVINGIAMRRSLDGGRTWGPYMWAVSDQSTDPSRPDMDIGGNPVPVYDATANKLILQFVRGLRNKQTQSQTCNPALTNWQTESFDDGLTWSRPVEISSFLGPWAGSLVGPATGIQLTDPKYKGRLVFCGHWGVYNSTQVWYSDDHGATYTLSSTVFESMDECTLAELSDGRVYLNMRNNHYPNYANGSSCDCRAYATSNDGGATFGERAFDSALISPVCQATLSTAGGALLFANPADTSSRMQGTIRKSLDMGKSWARELHITPVGMSPAQGGSFDYSCLVPAPLNDDRSLGGLLWSHNTQDGWLALFTRFPLGF